MAYSPTSVVNKDQLLTSDEETEGAMGLSSLSDDPELTVPWPDELRVRRVIRSQ